MKRLITFTSAALLLCGLAHGALAQTAKQPVDNKFFSTPQQIKMRQAAALRLAAQKKARLDAQNKQTALQAAQKKQNDVNLDALRKEAQKKAEAQHKLDEQAQEAKKKIEALRIQTAQAQAAKDKMEALRKQDELHPPVKGQHPLPPRHPRTKMVIDVGRSFRGL